VSSILIISIGAFLQVIRFSVSASDACEDAKIGRQQPYPWKLRRYILTFKVNFLSSIGRNVAALAFGLSPVKPGTCGRIGLGGDW
jgi:hypothetical protein